MDAASVGGSQDAVIPAGSRRQACPHYMDVKTFSFKAFCCSRIMLLGSCVPNMHVPCTARHVVPACLHAAQESSTEPCMMVAIILSCLSFRLLKHGLMIAYHVHGMMIACMHACTYIHHRMIAMQEH